MDTSVILEHIEKKLNAFSTAKASEGAENVWKWSGELDSSLVHSISQDLEARLMDSGASKQSLKRTFTILIEGLQNIHIHSSRRGETPLYGLGVAFLNDQVDILLISLAETGHIKKVSGLVTELNAMAPTEIKQHYRQTMNNGEMSDKGGAGLGLITMVMKAVSGMEIKDDEIGDSLHLMSSSISAA